MAVWLTMSLSQGTPNETARTNTVTASVTVHYSGGSYNGNSPSGTLTIDGQSFSFTCNFNYAGIGQGAVTTGTGSVTACTRTVTVSYGSSTTKTVSASASFNSGTASGTVSTSGSINLTSISAGGSSGGGGGDDGEEGGDEGGGSGSGGIVVTPGNVTVVGQATLTSRNEPYYQTTSYSPVACGVIPYSCSLKLTTPGFTGVSNSLNVTLYVKDTWETDDLKMCYALCDSDENYLLYIGAQSVVNDPNQIVCGTLSRQEWEMPFTIQTDKLESRKDYYLIFWLPSDAGLNESAGLDVSIGHTVNLTYTAGGDSGGDDVVTPSVRRVLFIDNESEFAEYECYIDNGVSWEKYEMYIDNGTAFELFG